MEEIKFKTSKQTQTKILKKEPHYQTTVAHNKK